MFGSSTKSENYTTDGYWSFWNWLPFTRLPGKVIAENMQIITDEFYYYQGTRVDLSGHIKTMQDSAQIFGGENMEQYQRTWQAYQNYLNNTTGTTVAPAPENENNINNSSAAELNSNGSVEIAEQLQQQQEHKQQEINVSEQQPLPPPAERVKPVQQHDTIVTVYNESCLDVAQKLYEKYGSKTVMLNLAQREKVHVCGLWWFPYAGTQEEYIERRSGVYRKGLDPTLNAKHSAALCKQNAEVLKVEKADLPTHHIPKLGCVYHESVPIIRDSKFNLLEKPWFIDIVAAGAVDLRDHKKKSGRNRYDEKKDYIDSKTGQLMQDKFNNDTMVKIRMILACAVMTRHETVLLGALGCGAFLNDPNVVANLFKQVLEEPEFKGKFKEVSFAVLGEPNYSIFKAALLGQQKQQ